MGTAAGHGGDGGDDRVLCGGGVMVSCGARDVVCGNVPQRAGPPLTDSCVTGAPGSSSLAVHTHGPHAAERGGRWLAGLCVSVNEPSQPA